MVLKLSLTLNQKMKDNGAVPKHIRSAVGKVSMNLKYCSPRGCTVDGTQK